MGRLCGVDGIGSIRAARDDKGELPKAKHEDRKERRGRRGHRQQNLSPSRFRLEKPEQNWNRKETRLKKSKVVVRKWARGLPVHRSCLQR